MKAVRIHSYGGSDQIKIEDAKMPAINDHEVLVRVYDAGVNPVDWKIREGHFRNMMPAMFPLTLGQDFSGEIVKVGAKVTRFTEGKKVYGFAHGTYAEYVAVSPDYIAAMPEIVSFETAAAIPTAGLTAWQILVDVMSLKAGQTLLIHGAAGGVGSFAVQIAKSLGAKIYATAAAEDMEYLTRIGVDLVMDYKSDEFENLVEGLDAVMDLVGGDILTKSFGVLRKGGIVVSSVGPVVQSMADKNSVRAVQFVMKQDAKGLEQIAKLVDQGVIEPRLCEVMPLSQARLAQDKNQTGRSHGKIVLQVM